MALLTPRIPKTWTDVVDAGDGIAVPAPVQVKAPEIPVPHIDPSDLISSAPLLPRSGSAMRGWKPGDGTAAQNILMNGSDPVRGDDTAGLATDAARQRYTGAYNEDRGDDGTTQFRHGGSDIQPQLADGRPDTNAHGLGMAAGTITYVGPTHGFGPHTTVIQLDNGHFLTYGHMSAASVKKGDRVKIGDPIGTVGSMGNSTGLHLHVQESIGGPFFNSPGFRGFVDPGKH